MSTITLPNIRVSSDLEIRLKLKDGGVAIDWSDLSNIKASIYSDRQRSLAGRCDIAIDEEDSTILVCRYSANKPQYPGVNRVIVCCTYDGETKTYDKPAFTFVRWTDDQAGQSITIDDPDIDVEITVEDISSSILQEAVEAANSAAERANDAAAAAEHMVDIHTGPAGADGADGKSAYELAVEEGYTGTEEEWLASLHGADGTDGTDGTDGKSAYEIAVDEGFVGTEEQWLASLKGEQGNTGSSVDYPYELVNNRTTDDATKGLSAAEGKRLGDDLTQLEAEVHNLSGKYYGIFEDAESLPDDADVPGYAFVGASEPFAVYNFDGEDWTDSGAEVTGIFGTPGHSPYIGSNGNWFEWDEEEGGYVDSGKPSRGVAGDTPAFTVGEVTTGEPGTPVVVTITGTAAAPVLNIQIPQGLQGNTGSSVDYPFELVNNRTTNDSTKALTAAEGKRLGDDIDLRATKTETVLLLASSDADDDLEIGDDDGNIILAISDGRIKTKRFDSSKLHTVPDKSILCIGDSLTMGTGAGKIYPNYLQALVGGEYVVNNLGEGGDKIQDIMARTNAFPAVTAAAFTIPASGSVSIGGLISSYDYARKINLLKQSQAVFNPVEIMGVKGYLTASGNYESVTYTFTRLIPGDAVSVPKWTPVYGNEGLNLGNSNVLILWGGQNGLFSNEDELVAMDKAVVEAMGIRDYCVIGPTNNDYQYDDYTRCVFDYDTLTAKMRKQFGCRYIDMLGYFLTDALSDAGITPTAADEAAIANDKVPPSLLEDTVHYNATGFELVANKIYQVLTQLNYL